MSAELRVEQLRKQFTTGRPAVNGVSFHVPSGEIVVLLGPSGCGKTTTLRCVAGLEHATGGRISIGGRVVSAPEDGVMVPPRLRNIGMVFQSYAVWPHMTVEQNVAYPLRHRGAPRVEIERRVGDVLDLVGLSEFARRAVVALSGGQMQRVALARSLVYRPQLLLLDEPLSNLDAQLRLLLRDCRRRFVRRELHRRLESAAGPRCCPQWRVRNRRSAERSVPYGLAAVGCAGRRGGQDRGASGKRAARRRWLGRGQSLHRPRHRSTLSGDANHL
jgi:ABC-type Fe3+/spermidine/putrescine transport system ATPase subunit